MKNGFTSFELQPMLMNNLANAGIIEPTEIQKETIPLSLTGKDVIGKARTGTGKTLAYLLPMIQRIEPQKRELQMLVLAPSRELSLQIQREAQRITKDMDIVIDTILEGMDINRQLDKLKKKPQLLIATPGRLMHIIGLNKLKMHGVVTIALDEVDQIVEMGLREKVLAIIKTTLKERQLLSFSATLSEEAKEVLLSIMKAPALINLDQVKPVPKGILHQYIVSKTPKKMETLEELLRVLKPQKSLVFINKNENVDRFVKVLKSLGFSVGGIQIRTKNQDRQHLVSSFNSGKLRILVTTDLFTRGMDFQNVTHIFNMDLPLNKIDYLHRAGRTGRMEKMGTVINIVRDREKFVLYKMMKLLNIGVKPMDIIGGKAVAVEEIIKRKEKRSGVSHRLRK
ncbi:MAG: DEAD/DEAH box helicase [Thermotaleaceae bacterium]